MSNKRYPSKVHRIVGQGLESFEGFEVDLSEYVKRDEIDAIIAFALEEAILDSGVIGADMKRRIEEITPEP